MSTPSFSEMLETWHMVTRAADPFLDTLTPETLQSELLINGEIVGQSISAALRRVIYHHWYHIGVIQPIRQMLGHTDVPEYVGDIEVKAPYRPE